MRRGESTVYHPASDVFADILEIMNGRFFAGQTVEAYIADGNEKFQKSSGKGDEEDDDEEKRLQRFGSWLEAGKN